MRSPHNTASRLDELDRMMRRDQHRAAAIAARVRFYVAVVESYAVRRLDSLATLAPAQSQLGVRSMDLVFEDSRYCDEVVARIVRRADCNPQFRAALVEQVGASCLDYWKSGQVQQLQLVAA